MHHKQHATQLKIFSWVIVLGALWIIALITLMRFQSALPVFEPDKTLATFELVENDVTLNEPISPLPIITTLDDNKVALGRQLFEDPILSENNTLSCNSCHKLQQGGVDNLPVSNGITGVANERNTPTIYNVSFNFRQFWDGREITLEDQLIAHTNKANLMGLSMAQIAQKLRSNTRYQEQFKNVYGSDTISENYVVDAITTFERALVTPAPLDDWLRGNQKAPRGQWRREYV
jgi:cytochrome c peroxidase